MNQQIRKRIYKIIYESDTPSGKLFDVILLGVIVMSIILVMLESVSWIDLEYHHYFVVIEWVITILFTLEYFLRIFCIDKPRKYIFSFYGLVDLISTIPMYLALFITGTHLLITIRAIRLLRVFRVLKLVNFLGESNNLQKAIKASANKIIVFIYAVIVLSVILGTIMYVVEGEENGFTNIPKSIYWTIVTLTTVGYGDIAPQTPLGQLIATFVMVLGYGIIAVPTGIVSAELTKNASKKISKSCGICHTVIVSNQSKYCHLCGASVE